MNIIKKIPTKVYYTEYLVINAISVYCFIKYRYNAVNFIGFLILFNAMVYISYVDINQKIISNKSLAILLVIRIVMLALNVYFNGWNEAEIISCIIAFVFGGLLLLLVSIISKKSIGMGDVKLVAVLGLYLGLEEIISCVLVSLILTAVIGSILIAMKKINKKSTIPFAPFLAIGIVMVVLLRM